VRFQVLTVGGMKMAAFSVVTYIIRVMEAASTSETSVNFYRTTQRNKPEARYCVIGN
jgi:hypothetical protein